MTAPMPRRQPLPLSTADRFEDGRRLRESVPRRTLAELPSRRRDPIALLERQHETRLQSLIPLRIERMSQSPFAFYRGSAILMADDLAHGPSTTTMVASCGDAHLANFGLYAAPDRQLIFDLNDFDEAAAAPWEWDLKRLVSSVVIAGQAAARDDSVIAEVARGAAMTYVRTIRELAQQPTLDHYFSRFDGNLERLRVDKYSRVTLRDTIARATKRTGERAVRRLTERDDEGRLRFIEAPPTMSRVPDQTVHDVHDYIEQYIDSTNVDVNLLMRRYAISDVIRRVVGVGSVGTRCFLVIFEDGDGEPLLLQAKEAAPSVLVQYGGIEQPPRIADLIDRRGDGARVVALQRMLQAQSDPFLGSFRGTGGIDVYVRQFHDMKGGIDTETLDDLLFGRYARACAEVLATAHAHSPDAPVVAGYVGKGNAVSDAIVEWSYAYADLSRADYELFCSAYGVE